VVEINAVAPAYFSSLRVPLRAGRDFTMQDKRDALPVAIVSESFAHRFFPGANPIGKRIKPHYSLAAGEPPLRQIVGVVGDARALSLRAEGKPAIYLPHAQLPVAGMSLVVRTATDSSAFVTSLRRAINQLDKDVPVFRVRDLSDYVAASVSQPRFHALLVGIFSAVALLLAAAGIFGVMSYAVTQRTHEIGIRLALGAQRGHVLRLIFSDGMRLVAIGAFLGIALVFAVGRFLSSLLYGVAATDPLTMISVILLLGFVALLACWWPAHRASSVDPVIALRSE
jgi:putative ABC transport system permease protein